MDGVYYDGKGNLLGIEQDERKVIMRVNICGIPHEVIECDDKFDIDLHFGQIQFAKGEIRINKNLSHEIKMEALCHEILHGILVHLGYEKESQDEQFVQAIANAINQSFEIKRIYDGCCIPKE